MHAHANGQGHARGYYHGHKKICYGRAHAISHGHARGLYHGHEKKTHLDMGRSLQICTVCNSVTLKNQK